MKQVVRYGAVNPIVFKALNEARVQNARLMNQLRLVTTSSLIVAHTLIPQNSSGVTGAQVQAGLVVLVCLALLLWRLGQQSDRLARNTAVAVPLLDMPIAFGVQWVSISGLDSDRAVANWTLAAYVCLMMIASLSLGRFLLRCS